MLLGFHDSNLARVKAAEKYMYNCDEIFVVASSQRVISNQNVEKIFKTSLGYNWNSSRPSQGLSLVCTYSEVRISYMAYLEYVSNNVIRTLTLMKFKKLASTKKPTLESIGFREI